VGCFGGDKAKTPLYPGLLNDNKLYRFVRAYFFIIAILYGLHFFPWNKYGRPALAEVNKEFYGLMAQVGFHQKTIETFNCYQALTLANCAKPIFVRFIRRRNDGSIAVWILRFAWSNKACLHDEIYFNPCPQKIPCLPVITVVESKRETLVAYTILTENYFFQWPGHGFLFMDAVSRVDTPLIFSLFNLFVGGMFVITNTLWT